MVSENQRNLSLAVHILLPEVDQRDSGESMSLSLYRPIASSSRTVLAPLVSTRTFASSSKSYAGAPKGAPSAEIQKRRAEEILLSKTQHQSDDIEYIGSYNRDEPTFLGFLRALEMQESWDLYDKVKKNDSILRGESKSSSCQIFHRPISPPLF